MNMHNVNYCQQSKKFLWSFRMDHRPQSSQNHFYKMCKNVTWRYLKWRTHLRCFDDISRPLLLLLQRRAVCKSQVGNPIMFNAAAGTRKSWRDDEMSKCLKCANRGTIYFTGYYTGCKLRTWCIHVDLASWSGILLVCAISLPKSWRIIM